MASNLIFVMSNLDNRMDGTSPGTQNWVQISFYSSFIRSKEINKITICSCFNKITNTQQYYQKRIALEFPTIFSNEILLHAILISLK